MPLDAQKARRMGVQHYNRCFPGESGLYVLADIRNFVRGNPEQIDLEVMAAEEMTDRDAWLIHVAQVQVYRYIQRLASATEEDVDRYEAELRERFERGEAS